MKHTMSRPCANCPFRNDIQGYLTGERVTQICESLLRGASFPCHKTTVAVEEDDGFTDMQPTAKSQQCAGAEIFLAHQGMSTQMSRIAERLGMSVSTLDMDAPVCRNHSEMMAVHVGEDEEGETCSIVDPGCLAPAGYGIGSGAIRGTDYVDTHCDDCGEPVCESCSRMVEGERVCNNCVEFRGETMDDFIDRAIDEFEDSESSTDVALENPAPAEAEQNHAEGKQEEVLP